MSNKATAPKPGNQGQTDAGRGDCYVLPVSATPNGRALSRKGGLSTKPNDASPDGLLRRAPGSGARNGTA